MGRELGVDYFVINTAPIQREEIGIDYDQYKEVTDDVKAESLGTADYVVQAKWNKIGAAGETEPIAMGSENMMFATVLLSCCRFRAMEKSILAALFSIKNAFT